MTAQNPYIRVPNLPNGQIADSDGNPTDDEITFRQALITSLQKNFGDEGLVAPTQSSANIAIIQDNTAPDPVTGISNIYTCAPGTIIYNSTNDTLMVSVLIAGVPTFKTFTLV